MMLRANYWIAGFVATLLASIVVVASAAALATYSYDVDTDTAAYAGTAASEIEVTRLNTGLSATVRVMRGVTELDRWSTSSGSDSLYDSTAGLVAGDVVQVFQPQLPPGPPGPAANESFTVPVLGFTSDTGASTLTGHAPDGIVAGIATLRDRCGAETDFETAFTPSGGSFSVPLATPIRAGTRSRITIFPGGGDRVRITDRTSGEFPCLFVDGSIYPQNPGAPPVPKPYEFYIQSLREDIPNIRVVASRGGTTYLDESQSTSSSASITLATRPLPGDRIDIYRPAAAPTPSISHTVPDISATFDPGNGLVAIQGAATTMTFATVHNTFLGGSNYYYVGSRPTGRTLVDFSRPFGWYAAPGIYDDATVIVSGVDAASDVSYRTSAVRGDLTAPVVKAAIKKPIRVGKIAKAVTLKLVASESTGARIALSLPTVLPNARNPMRRPGKRMRIVAKRTFNLSAGTSTVKIPLSKSGRSAVKQLRAAGRRLRAVPLTVTVTSTDSAGNKSTLVQKARIVR
jgi:hypothetical protein